MSLLMEALKKAEAAKRQASEEGAAVPPGVQSAPSNTAIPEGSLPRSPLPELALHSDSIDADLAAVPTTTPPRRTAAASAAAASAASQREAAERLAAHNVFLAKQAASSGSSRIGLWSILGLAGVAALAIGGYFWWQLQGVSTQAPPRPAPVPPSISISPAPSSAAAVSTAPPAPSSPVPAAAAPSTASPGSATEMPRPASATPVFTARQQRPTEEQRPSSKPAPDLAPTTAGTPLRLNKTRTETLSQLENAYDALQSGHLEDAQRGYAQILRRDPRNPDALLGLASLALRQGKNEQAQAYYLQVLEFDPNDATAQAGIINLRGQSDTGASESRLKSALSRQPESGPLHFALGNFYARQQRWNEAQQAFFKAYSCEGDNPDYLFNLAVSLDHLRQPRLAAQYYRLALDAASAVRSVSFDPQQAQKRLGELQP